MTISPVRAFLLTLGAIVIGFMLGRQITEAAWAAGRDPYLHLETFARVQAQIRAAYVEPKTDEELIYAAIRGMTSRLDEQSAYFDPSHRTWIEADQEGQDASVGAVVSAHPEGGLRIDEVLDGGPGALAGLKLNDQILQIDGRDLKGMSLLDALNLLNGPRGTTVTLTLQREGESAPVVLPVVRDEVRRPTVSSELLPNGIAYLRLEQFRRNAAEDVSTRLAALEAANKGPLRGLLLDMRDNPGGLLDDAVAIADLFLSEGVIVSTRGRLGVATDEERVATRKDSDRDVPIVILLNGRSASAAELVAGALQDHKRALIVGEPSYGKGSVQTWYEYPDGSALKLTIARYALPSGRVLTHGEGVAPDELVATPRVGSTPTDVLRGMVAASTYSDEAKAALVARLDELPPDPPPASPSFVGPVKSRLEADPQLKRGLERLNERAKP